MFPITQEYAAIVLEDLQREAEKLRSARAAGSKRRRRPLRRLARRPAPLDTASGAAR